MPLWLLGFGDQETEVWLWALGTGHPSCRVLQPSGTVGDSLAPPGDRGAHSRCQLQVKQAEAVLAGLSVGRAAGHTWSFTIATPDSRLDSKPQGHLQVLFVFPLGWNLGLSLIMCLQNHCMCVALLQGVPGQQLGRSQASSDLADLGGIHGLVSPGPSYLSCPISRHACVYKVPLSANW